MKKALIVTSVASMIDQFNEPNIKVLQELGYDVDVACNFIEGNTCNDEQLVSLKARLNKTGVSWYQIDFARSVSKLAQNVRAYRQLNALSKDNNYDLVHCQSPIGGLIGREVFRNHKRTGTKVIYTAHGFHFYKGAPLKNWLLYYPIERFESHKTDVLITINTEDYEFAKRKMMADRIEYVPGIGIDIDNFSKDVENKRTILSEIGVPIGTKVLMSVGELNKNKNQQIVIRALAMIKDKDIHYLIAGKGDLKEDLESLSAELGIRDRIHFLGFRNDINYLYKCADVMIHPSYREGLSVAVMEALASNLPVIGSDIRGNRDLIQPGVNGELFNPGNIESLCGKLKQLDRIKTEKSGLNAKFSRKSVMDRIREIYG